MNQTKTCIACGLTLNLRSFERQRRKDGSESYRPKCWCCRHAGYRDNRSPAEKTRRAKAWQRANPEKRRAHLRAQSAVRNGTLVKPEACQRCGVKTGTLDKHHEDYSKPLLVMWVCRRCHRQMS